MPLNCNKKPLILILKQIKIQHKINKKKKVQTIEQAFTYSWYVDGYLPLTLSVDAPPAIVVAALQILLPFFWLVLMSLSSLYLQTNVHVIVTVTGY